MQPLTHEFFTARLEEIFKVSVGDMSFDMTLIQVKRAPARFASPARSEPFSLYFKCHGEMVPAQGTYLFANPQAGDIEIFVVPTGPENGAMIYEAIFN